MLSNEDPGELQVSLDRLSNCGGRFEKRLPIQGAKYFSDAGFWLEGEPWTYEKNSWARLVDLTNYSGLCISPGGWYFG